ncbi:hypothetical protein JTE90_009183 [Oedothorax gibbosus]|uniref:Gustatory receptor n=1 Tax=Oedothorax gibbosus TaxID=931172 RepID=A0AAV6UXA6_9ARAC|nr:hypothetical protein JTE90_009183 [Oedothorax gibbosus]
MLLNISGIFPFNRCNGKPYKSLICESVKATISVVFILVYIYLVVLEVKNCEQNKNPVINTLANIIMLFYRCFILFKWSKLQKICSLTSSFGTKNGRKYKFWVTIWLLISVVKSVLLEIYDILAVLDDGIPYIHYGIPKENTVMYTIVAALHSLYFFFAYIPIIALDLFYVLVCDNLRCAIKNFSVVLSSDTKDYDVLLRSYATIKSSVRFIDDELSVFVFFNVTLSSVMMYQTISLILHTEPKIFAMSTIQVLVHFFYTLAAFVAVIISASMVSEASDEVRLKTQDLKLDKTNAMVQLRFQSCAESEVHLTVWKMVPLRRSFALGTISAIFTYSILFDNLTMK